MMISIRWIGFISAACLLLLSCSKNETQTRALIESPLDTITINHSDKGWEVYSWPLRNSRQYAILIGTNRTKTYDEVTLAKGSATCLIQVLGIDSLTMVLARFPENETITLIGPIWLQKCWNGYFGKLSLPSENDIEIIRQSCKEHNQVLQVVQ